MECIQIEKKVLNTDINKLNWRFNQIFFLDHKPGRLLYACVFCGLSFHNAGVQKHFVCLVNVFFILLRWYVVNSFCWTGEVMLTPPSTPIRVRSPIPKNDDAHGMMTCPENNGMLIVES